MFACRSVTCLSSVCSLMLACGLVGCSNNATSEHSRKAAAKPTAQAGAKAAPGAKPAAKAPVAKSSLPQLSGDHHSVFALLDNRMLAHVVRQDGLAVPASHPGVAKYLNFGRPWRTWRINKTAFGQRVALGIKNVSWLSVPLTAQQARQTTTLAMRLRAAVDQGLRVELNDSKLPAVTVRDDWQRVVLEVPPGVLRPGENRIALRWGKAGRIEGSKAFAAVQWLYLGKAALPEQAAVEVTRDGKLYLPKDGGVAYYVHPYRGAKLKLAFAAQPAAQRCDVAVTLRPEGKKRPVEVVLSETGKQSGITETFVDLDPVAGEVSRLELMARGNGCQGLALEQAAIVMPGRAPTVQRSKRPKNVIFWMVDNVRADRYRPYNPKTRVKTPVFDQLAATGTVFTRAYIQGTESRVSHASIWTGLYPKQHRFVAPKAKLNLRWVTLAEAAQKAGLYTAAWIANGFVSKFWGFGEGWSAFRNTLHKGGGLHAEALANHGIGFIESRGDKPFYLYVGTIDPHVSWRGRQPWLRQYDPGPYNGPYTKTVWGKDVEKIATGKVKVSPRDRKRIVAIYDSTVSYNDHHLGRLLEALKKKGIRDDTMIIVTADHGEELWDFGRIGHGHSCRNALVAVPLLVHYPPLFGSGVRVTEGVDVLSLMATILDAIGAPIPEQVQGASLLPLAQGVGRGYPRPSLATQYELAHTIRLEEYKLRSGSKGIKLHDLASPRGEHEEIAAKHPLVTRWLTDALSTFLTYQSRWRQSRWGVASNHLPAMPTDLETDKAPDPIRP